MSIEASQLYQGGSCRAVECCVCGSSSTSGSWRPGWAVPGVQGRVNLCNKCGQRWQKAGRPSSVAALNEAEWHKAAGCARGRASDAPTPVPPLPGSQAAGAAGSSALKRVRMPSLTLTPQPRPRRRLSSGDSPASSEDTLALDRSRNIKGLPSQPFAAPSMCPGPQHCISFAVQQPQMAARPAVPGARRFVSYCVQSVSSGKAKHAAFWVQDERGESTLAVVGTDTRLSGHFVYSSTPAFVNLGIAPALRCTNRSAVEAWLAGFGCGEQVVEGSVSLPQLSAEEKRRVFNPEEPVWARPTALSGSWQGVREESGRLVDGRHFKRFWLLGPGGTEKLVVSGVDSLRKDRRYKYLAQQDMGGFAFENSREVLAWINFVLQRPADTPLEPELARCPQLLREEELGSLVARLQAAAQQEQVSPPLPGTRPGASASQPAAAPSLGNSKVRPMQLIQLGLDEEMESPPASPRAATATPTDLPTPTLASTGVAAATMLPPRPPAIQLLGPTGLGCTACGVGDHTSEDCLLVAVSPSALIRTASLPGCGVASCAHHRTLSLLLFSDRTPPQSGGGGGGDAGGSSSSHLAEEGAWQALPSPQLLSHEQLRAALHAEVSSLEPAFTSRPITPGIQQAFSRDPQLLAFVSSAPSAATHGTFARWAGKLSSHISDFPPPLPTCAEDTPVGSWSWTPTHEALIILQELSSLQVNLALLQSTGISPAVAQLRNHRNRDIAAAAEGIVARWRASAVSVLEQVTDLLERRG